MHDEFNLPEALQSLLRDEIRPGEPIRWSGQPQAGSGFHWLMLPQVLFAIPWTAFAIFWMVGAAGLFDDIGPPAKERLIFAAFGIPFVGIGMAMLLSPFWMRRRLKRAAANTLYVVTDRRAVVFNGGYYGNSGLAMMMGGMMMRLMPSGIKVQSFSHEQLRNIERIERADGTGDILLGQPPVTIPMAPQLQEARAGFYSIRDVRQVDRMLKDLADIPRPGAAQ